MADGDVIAAGGDGDRKEEQDRLALLPNDVIADVLHRVPPRWLVASRCVCRAWRDAVDDSGVLRPDLLPRSLAGLFIHFEYHKFPEFFSRPSSSSRAVSGRLDFLPSVDLEHGFGWDCDDWFDYVIRDHCNGLLLLRNNRVVNPATRRWNALPPRPADHVTGIGLFRQHLVFDPTISHHYEVFRIFYRFTKHDQFLVESEWAPSVYKMNVFSSCSGCWEERSFVREGDVTGTVRGTQAGLTRLTAVYWRGSLYVHCVTGFLMRVCLSHNKYRVIELPADFGVGPGSRSYLVRSKNGVYFVSRKKCWLRVWILNESSCDQMKWILKHDKDLKPILARHWFHQRAHGPWILEDINYNMFISSRFPKVDVGNGNDVKHCNLEDRNKAMVEDEFEWNSDNDDTLDNGGRTEEYYSEANNQVTGQEKFEWNCIVDNGGMVAECYTYKEKYEIEILGLHPYKEIVFLSESAKTGLAYHLNSSKVEVLGNIYPNQYAHFKESNNELDWIQTCAPYTPCWIEEFPGY